MPIVYMKYEYYVIMLLDKDWDNYYVFGTRSQVYFLKEILPVKMPTWFSPLLSLACEQPSLQNRLIVMTVHSLQSDQTNGSFKSHKDTFKQRQIH